MLFLIHFFATHSLRFFRCLLLLYFSGAPVFSNGQNFSSFGTEFYVSFPAHFSGTQALLGIYITSHKAAKGSVTAGARVYNFAIQANEVRRIFLGEQSGTDGPNTEIYQNQRDGIKSGSAIRINSDEPVAVYVHVINQFRSGATLALPVTTWGKEYILPGYGSNGGIGNGVLNVIAREPGTVVEITPSARSADGTRAANVPFTITLANAGDVYQLLLAGGADISGTTVKSIAGADNRCKTIGVFSASTWSFFGCEQAIGADNLLQQVFPVNTWGRKFLYVPFINRQETIFRVYAQDTGTVITRREENVPRNIVVPPGGFAEFRTATPGMLTANKPVMLVQYMTSQSCDPRNTNLCSNNGSCLFPGNPEMILLNPVEQYIDSITLFSPHRNWIPGNQSNIFRCFINVAIPTEAASSFRINNRQPVAGFIPLPGTGYSYLLEELSSEAAVNPVHALSAGAPFSCIAYGIGNLESYGFNAGTRLIDLKQQILFAGDTLRAATYCPGGNILLAVEVPYRITSARWLANDQVLLPAAPAVPDGFRVVNGDTLFRYKWNNPLQLPVPGRYAIRAFVTGASSAVCNGEQEIISFLEILGRPQPGFFGPARICLSDSLVVNSIRPGNEFAIAWQWAVENGGRASGDRAAFSFAAPGQYTVRQWASVNGTCASDTFSVQVQVVPNPVAVFRVPAVVCAGQPVTLQDESAGNIVRRIWRVQEYFTDTSFALNKTVQFARPGNYAARLSVKDGNNCPSPFTETILNVAPVPEAGFNVPGVCLDDAVALFDNTTRYEGGDLNGFGWRWHFGDAAATPANPDSSAAKEGRHKYSATGNYSVSLVAISRAGCADTLQRVITVNGANPTASFELVSEQPFCTGKPLVIRNNSSVDFGNITRLVIYWNWGVNNLDTTIDNNPLPRKEYSRLLFPGNTPGSADVAIRMEVFSGVVCRNDTIQSIAVLPSPRVIMDSLPPVCVNEPFINLTQAREANGVLGNGVYLGAGVAPDGRFVPSAPGLQSISYLFTAANGCRDSAVRSLQVLEAPKVDAGPDKTVVQGNSIMLEGSILSGVAGDIRWRPAVFLNDSTLLRPTAVPLQNTRYRIVVRSANNCSAHDDMEVTVLLNPVIPNAFSPNGDGINDVWHISALDGYANVRVLVFDRYGRSVFESLGYSRPWNGSYQGKPLPSGVYYYIIADAAGKLKLNGSVTLIR